MRVRVPWLVLLLPGCILGWDPDHDTAPPTACGDGLVEGAEACDDGEEANDGRYGGCNADCTLAPFCGDGAVDRDLEACDEGDEANDGRYGGCNEDCTLAAYCGDGVLQPMEEICDDGVLTGFGGCTLDCEIGATLSEGETVGQQDTLDVALIDLDDDGFLDAAKVNTNCNNCDRVWVWRNERGVSSLWGGSATTVNIAPTCIAAGAWWNTSFLVVGHRSAGLSVLISDGSGGFDVTSHTESVGGATGLALGDFNGDPYPDVAVAHAAGGWGTDPEFATDRSWLLKLNGIDSTPPLGTQNSTDAAVGDLDGDGDVDAVVTAVGATCDEGEPNVVYRNDGGGDLSANPSTFGVAASTGIALGDLDGDGDLDALVTNSACTTGLPDEVWLNDGSGAFMLHQSLGTSPSQDVALGDLDGDGDLDAFIAVRCEDCASSDPNRGNQVWLNDGRGTFVDSGLRLGFANSQVVALGDLDNDGDLDAYVGNEGPDQIWRNTRFE